MRIFWVYWLFCFLVGFSILRKSSLMDLVFPKDYKKNKTKPEFKIIYAALWFMAIVGSYVAMKYLIVDAEPLVLHLPSAILLPILTGLTETLLILSMFVIGTGLGYRLFPKRKAVHFFCGYLFYVLINAVIHIGFWNWMLPMHFYANIYIVIFGQQVFSLLYCFIFYRYRALYALILLHIFFYIWIPLKFSINIF